MLHWQKLGLRKEKSQSSARARQIRRRDIRREGTRKAGGKFNQFSRILGASPVPRQEQEKCLDGSRCSGLSKVS